MATDTIGIKNLSGSPVALTSLGGCSIAASATTTFVPGDMQEDEFRAIYPKEIKALVEAATLALIINSLQKTVQEATDYMDPVSMGDLDSLFGDIMSIYAKVTDWASATVLYTGWAAPGTAQGTAAWRIRKRTYTGDNSVDIWADGNNNFDNDWSNRVNLSYS